MERKFKVMSKPWFRVKKILVQSMRSSGDSMVLGARGEGTWEDVISKGKSLNRRPLGRCAFLSSLLSLISQPAKGVPDILNV